MKPCPLLDQPLLWSSSTLAQTMQLAFMAQQLQSILAETKPEQQYRLCTIHLIDGKAYERAIIRYDLIEEQTHTQFSIYGKLYANRQRATQVYETMQSLWGQVFHHAPEIGIPQPLGLIGDLGLVLYIPVDGQFLHELLLQEGADHWICLSAAWLSRLHQHALVIDKRFDVDNELHNLQSWGILVGAQYPIVQAQIDELLAYLHQETVSLHFTAGVPIHKDFHYQHIIVNGRLAVIDFDEMRLGDPNFDLAHFCANLHLLAARSSLAPTHFARLQNTFLETYQRQTQWVADQRFLYFFIYTCIKLAKQLCTQRGPYPRPTGAEQARQVQMIVQRGIDALRRTADSLLPTIPVA